MTLDEDFIEPHYISGEDGQGNVFLKVDAKNWEKTLNKWDRLNGGVGCLGFLFFCFVLTPLIVPNNSWIMLGAVVFNILFWSIWQWSIIRRHHYIQQHQIFTYEVLSNRIVRYLPTRFEKLYYEDIKGFRVQLYGVEFHNTTSSFWHRLLPNWHHIDNPNYFLLPADVEGYEVLVNRINTYRQQALSEAKNS